MKICLINNLYSPYTRGGAETVVENIVNGLKNKSHDVFVITTKPLYHAVDVQNSEPLHDTKIYRFFPFNFFSVYHINKFTGGFWEIIRLIWHVIDMFNFHSYFKIKRILNQEKPDIVMTHNLMGMGFFIPRLIKKLKIKHIHTVHDVQLVYPTGLLIKDQENKFLNRFFLTQWWQNLNRKLFASPDIVVFPSTWLQEFYQSWKFFKNSKLVTLPNPIPGLPQNHVPVSVENQARRFINDQNINFLFVGQIEEHKGIIFLIQVFQRLVEHNQLPIRLHIVGDGALLDKAKKIAGKKINIKFYGRLPNDQVLELYNQIDCVIVPSFCYENSPTVIYESLSFGTPVIASDLGGIGELVEPGKNGWLFEVGNTEDLLEIMRIVSVLSIEDRSKIGQNCLESIQNYKLDNYIEKLINFVV